MGENADELGPTYCPGKALAMMELRDVVARTVREFDVRFPKGVEFDLDFFEEINGHSIVGVASCELVFT